MSDMSQTEPSAESSAEPPIVQRVDLPDLRRRILADEQVSLAELRQAVSQLRTNRIAPPEKKQSTGRSKSSGKTVQLYALDDLLDG